MNNDIINVTQLNHIAKLQKLKEESVGQSSFVLKRARGADIASVCRSDLKFGFVRASRVLNSSTIDAKRINRSIEYAEADVSPGLSFVPIYVSTCQNDVFEDASFSFNADPTSQLGFSSHLPTIITTQTYSTTVASKRSV